jgi:hypothetical protein
MEDIEPQEVEEPSTEEVTEEVKEEKPAPFKPKDLPEDEEWEFVDITDPKLQKRFNRVYASLKNHKKISEEASTTAAMLAEKLEKLEAQFNEKLTSDTNKEYETTLKTLEKERKNALLEGEHDRVLELTDQIFELKLEKREAKKLKEEKKEEPKKEQPQEVSFDTLPKEDQDTLISFTTAKDKQGNLQRPWFHPEHPEHKVLVKLAEAVIEEADGPVDIQDMLEETDRRMRRYLGIEKPKKKPSTIESADLPANKGMMGLSPEQERVAVMMFPGDRKKAIEKYKKALESN